MQSLFTLKTQHSFMMGSDMVMGETQRFLFGEFKHPRYFSLVIR